jgi:hypothetical protein
MSTPLHPRVTKALELYASVERMGRRRAHEAEWKATDHRAPLRIVPPSPPTVWDRIADACWRLHDGMPLVWALASIVVLAASVASLAIALGWQP